MSPLPKANRSDLAKAEPSADGRLRRPRPRRAASGAPNPLQVQAWTQLPDKAPADNSTSSLALGLAPIEGLNGSEEAQAAGSERFRRIIEPIINPGRYADLHNECGNKGEVIRRLAGENKTSARSIYRRLEHWSNNGITGLLRKVCADKGRPRALNQASVNYIISAACPKPGSYGEFSISDIYRLHEEERAWREEHAQKPLCPADRVNYAGLVDADGRFLPAAQLSKASKATFCRQFAKIPDLVKVMARRGNDAYRNGELISYRDLASVQPLDYVVMDHRVLDIFCLSPERGGWKLGRPWLTAAIDMRTRKWLGWCIVETPSSDSIATVLKSVFVNFGLPKAVYWDNGKDFRCQWLEGRHEHYRSAGRTEGLPEKWAGVMESLGVRVHHAIVKNARAKLIEPNFGRVSDFDRTLPEWCGHKPGARPERFDALLRQHEAWLHENGGDPPFRTIGEVAKLYDSVLEDLNERELHGDGMRKTTVRGMGWMCPNEAWEILIPRVERRTIPEDVLQLCFAKRRELTIHNGIVQATFDSKPYRYRLTGNHMALLALNGRKVELAYDPLDLGKAAVYYESTFLGLAECVELHRMGEDSFVQDERDRRAARREVKRFIAAVHQAVPVPGPETYLERRRAVAPVRVDPQRSEAAAELPSQIAAAHAAQTAEAEFSFATCEAEVPVVRHEAVAGDDEFRFFGDQGEA
jgi:transposase InsO family protein